MSIFYDKDGYYCLVIAVLKNVDASQARIIYRYGLNHPASQEILEKVRLVREKVAETKEGKEEFIKKLRKEKYSLEAIADALGCSVATVRRHLKKYGEE